MKMTSIQQSTHTHTHTHTHTRAILMCNTTASFSVPTSLWDSADLLSLQMSFGRYQQMRPHCRPGQLLQWVSCSRTCWWCMHGMTDSSIMHHHLKPTEAVSCALLLLQLHGAEQIPVHRVQLHLRRLDGDTCRVPGATPGPQPPLGLHSRRDSQAEPAAAAYGPDHPHGRI